MGVRALLDLAVEDRVAVLARLLENGLAHHVAALEFLDEALAFLVDQDGAFEACVVDELDGARVRVAHRIGLDEAHVDDLCADVLRHRDAFTHGAGHVRGLEAVAVERVGLRAHRNVRGKAARRDHDALPGTEGIALAVHRGLDARDASRSVTHELLGLHVRDDGNAALLGRSAELSDEVEARGALRNERALLGVAAEEEVVFLEFDADDVPAPFGGGKRILDHGAHDGGIALHVAALHGVLIMQFNAVAFNAELLLDPVARSGHFRARNERVAANVGHLFEKHDLRARVARGDGGREARAARTDHHDVVDVRLRHLRRALEKGHRARERHARLGRSLLHGVPEGVRRDGRARHGIDVGRVVLDHRVLHFGEDLAREDRVLVRFSDVDRLNPAAVKGHCGDHVAVLADARALGRDGRSHGGNGKRRYCKTDERFVQCHGRLLSDWCGHEVNVAKKLTPSIVLYDWDLCRRQTLGFMIKSSKSFAKADKSHCLMTIERRYHSFPFRTGQ